MNRSDGSTETADWAALRRALPALGLGLLVFGLLFHAEAAAAVTVWIASTAYNHCFLILPIALYLAWERRGMIAGLVPRPAASALLLALPLVAGWLLADRLGIMEGRQLAVMSLLQILFLAVLGWTLYARLAVPLLYLYFLVPFGSFLTPALQGFTTRFVVTGLDWLGIPNFNDGHVIEIPEGAFRIAQACAGLRFLIASIAFGVLYACLIYRRPWKRLVFLGVSFVVPVIANGLRALGIVWLGHALGSAQAAATDHVVYGYIFFSIVILLLILLGLPFADKPAPRVARTGPSAPRTPPALLLAAALGVATLASLGPLGAAALDRAAAAPLRPRFALPGCTAAPARDRAARTIAGSGGRLLRFSCRGGIALAVAVFPPRSDPRPAFDAQNLLGGFDFTEPAVRSLRINGATPARWVFVFSTKSPFRAAASALWIAGHPASGSLKTRLRQALNSFAPRPLAPLVIAIRPLARNPADAAARIRAFLAAEPDLAARLAHLVRNPS